EVAVGRSGRHLRRQKRRADLRLCRTDRIRGRLLSEPGLPLGRTRPPRVVRRGTRGHPSRLRTPVIGSPVDDIVVGRPTDLPCCAEAPTRPYVGRVGATDRAFCARMAGSFESLPLPDDPTLAAWSAALNAPGYWAYLFDASWRYVFVTDELRVALGGTGKVADVPLGSHFFSAEATRFRNAIAAGGLMQPLDRPRPPFPSPPPSLLPP